MDSYGVAVIEVLDRDGQVRWVHRVLAGTLRIGRSPACDLVLSDPHLAAEHALLHWDGQDARLELLDSLNGGRLADEALAPREPRPWMGSHELLLGTTRLRLRSSRDPLAPEQPLPAATAPARAAAREPGRLLPAFVLAALWGGLLWLDHWLGSGPDSSWVEAATAVLSPLAVAVVWAALWALVSQLFRHWFAFLPHLRRALVALLGLQLLSMGLPSLAYILSWPRLMALDGVLTAAGLLGLLWWQASLVWPRARRWVGGTLASLALLGLALVLGKRTEQQHWLGPAYLSSLPPPVLRLAPTRPLDGFVDGLKALEEPLRQQAAKRNEQQEPGSEE